LGEKCSYLGLVFIFGRFSSLGSCNLVLSIFLTILMRNNNNMTENDMRMGWVQKQVMGSGFGVRGWVWGSGSGMGLGFGFGVRVRVSVSGLGFRV